MENGHNNQRNYVVICVDVLALITATFGAILTRYKVSMLVLGIVTCLILIALLAKDFGIGGAVIGIVISIVLMALMIMQVSEAPVEEFSDKITEDTKIGILELQTKELIMGYSDLNGNNKITTDININEDICKSIVLKSLDYDVVLEEYKVQDGKLVFPNIPVGTYELRIQLDGFSLYSGTIKLKESELEEDVWNETICLQSDNDYKEFQIIITDKEGESLKGQKCDFNILNTEYLVKDIVSDDEGKLPYTFNLPSNLEFQVTLFYDEETYTNKYLTSEVENPLKIQFSTPSKKKNDIRITPLENHQPDDAATIVSLPTWNVDEDMGIDGKRYGGGIKVSISDMFIGMGANGRKDVTSRITLPLDGDYDSTIFTGVFILDQSMYGKESTGTISILINNEQVFTTGEIGGNTLNAFPFSVDFGNADSIIILTEAHLCGSDFIYGLVEE